MTVDLSIVVPVYGCEGCLAPLHRRLSAALGDLGVSYEIVFVDDGGVDRGWEELLALAQDDPAVRLVRLSRNFGQHAAITAGLAESGGRFVVVMDCDLEDRPEEIPRLWAKAQEGFEIVYGARQNRGHSRYRRLSSRAYATLMNATTGSRLDPQRGNFSIVSRKVVDAFLELRDRDRQYLMMLGWLGFDSTSIDVQQGSREAGSSAYSFGGLIRFALDGVFFQTTVLLRWIVYLGFALSFLGLGLAVFFVLNYFFRDPYPGWTSIGVLLLVVGGVIVVTLGVIGLYIGRIYSQVKDRPLYVVDRRVGGASESVDLVEP